jgi:predicted 3-demethylubiquinone-9 3-methyltransferase (glyoxalase superfamily)
MPTINPSLWYSREAEEAAKFYASIFPNSRVDRVSALPADSPSGPAGSVKIVEFTLLGQPFQAFSAGPLDQFNHAISLVVTCDTQEEIDRYWDALLQGGAPEQCGWLKDRYGLSWQIVPKQLAKLMTDPDPEKAKRAGEAMLQMVKLDIAELERAAAGKAKV